MILGSKFSKGNYKQYDKVSDGKYNIKIWFS